MIRKTNDIEEPSKNDHRIRIALRRHIRERLSVFPLDGQQPLELIEREQLLAFRGRFGDRGIDEFSRAHACMATMPSIDIGM